MSVDGDCGDDMGHDLGLDDVVVERLLTGDVSDLIRSTYVADSVPLGALGAFVTAVRGLSTCDVPRPSAELSAFLNGETGANKLATVTPIGPGRWRRRVMVASVAALVAGSVVSAAAAEVLPRVVQRPVAAIINALTPFELHPPGHTMSPVRETPVTVGSTVSPAVALPIIIAPTSIAPTSIAPTSIAPTSIAPTSIAPTIPSPITIPAPTTFPAPTTPVASTLVVAPEVVSPNQDKPLAPSTSTPPGRHSKDTLVKPEPVATVLSGEVRAPKTHRKTKASKSKAAPTASPTPDTTQPPLPEPAADGNGQGNTKDKHPERGGTGDQNKSDNAKESGKPTEPTDQQPPVVEPPAVDDHGGSTKSNGNSQQPSDPPGKRADK